MLFLSHRSIRIWFWMAASPDLERKEQGEVGRMPGTSFISIRIILWILDADSTGPVKEVVCWT